MTVLKDFFVGVGKAWLGWVPASGLSAERGPIFLVLLWKVHSRVVPCSWDFGNEEWHTAEKPVSRVAG